MKQRFGCMSILIPCLLLFFGIDNINFSARDYAKAARYPHPITLTYKEFVHRNPSEGWFHVTGGVLDLASASSTRLSVLGDAATSGAVISVDAPFYSAKSPGKQTTQVIVDSMDRNLCVAWDHLHKVQEGIAADGPRGDGSDASSAEAEDAKAATRLGMYALNHPDKAFFARDVEGIVKRSIDANAEGIRLYEGQTSADYKTHNATIGILMVAAATLYWGWRVRNWLSERRGRDKNKFAPR